MVGRQLLSIHSGVFLYMYILYMYVVTSFRCWQPGLTHRGNYSNTWTFVQWSKPRSNQTGGGRGMIPQPPRALSGTGTRRLWSWSWGFSSVSWPLHVLLSAIGNELLLSPPHDKWEKDNPWWLRCEVYFFFTHFIFSFNA